MKKDFLAIDQANLYYEMDGSGTPLIMIHAGVADHRQWNHEFALLSERYQTIRYDLRGYGKSIPVPGVYSHLGDLAALVDSLQVNQPFYLMGCSIGGGLAIDYTLEYPEKVKGLILVGAGPSGLVLDVEESSKFSDASQAFEAGDLDLAAEIETQIWFDGEGRSPDQIDPDMRQLAYEMNRIALGHEAKQLGDRRPNTDQPAYRRLAEIKVPVLIIVGANDEAYTHGAADTMKKELDLSEVVVLDNAAHLANMDQPEQFGKIVSNFLEKLDG